MKLPIRGIKLSYTRKYTIPYLISQFILRIIPITTSNCALRKHPPFLGKASLRSNGVALLPNLLSSSENPAQNRLVLSQRARFKAAYCALHEFEKAPLFLHSRALIKRL
jgi:hypothetical protein